MGDKCLIRGTKSEWGFLNNMSKHRIVHESIKYETAEHLFQSLRFHKDSFVRMLIRKERKPFAAKKIAKKYPNEAMVEQFSKQDLRNMHIVLKLKLDTHTDVKECLNQTEYNDIIEDCSNRRTESGLFWGAAFNNNIWKGANHLGKIWMDIRQEVIDKRAMQ